MPQKWRPRYKVSSGTPLTRAFRAIRMLMEEARRPDFPVDHFEMSGETASHIRDLVGLNGVLDIGPFSFEEGDGAVGSIHGVPILENNAVEHGKARIIYKGYPDGLFDSN